MEAMVAAMEAMVAAMEVDMGTASENIIRINQSPMPKSYHVPRILQLTVIPSLSDIPCMIGQPYKNFPL
jgi:hypothetical protein